MIEETPCSENCISEADIDRYSRMKWGILGLLSLIPFLLWLSTQTVTAGAEVTAVPNPISTKTRTETSSPEPETATDIGTETDSSTGNNNYNMQHEKIEVNVYLDNLLLPLSVTPESPGIVETKIVTETITEIVVTVQPITQTVTMTEFIEITRVVILPPPPPYSGEGHGCTRFDLEVGRDKETGTPVDGIYIMQELSGHRVATWSAQKGWLDSGWMRDLPISRHEVHVQVFFYPASGTGPVELEILNPAPNLPYGWISSEKCHAVEIQFPK